jgi:hypothetical protein
MTEGTSAAIRVMDGLEQPPFTKSDSRKDQDNIFKSNTEDHADDFANSLNFSYMNHSANEGGDQSAHFHEEFRADEPLLPLIDDQFKVKIEALQVTGTHTKPETRAAPVEIEAEILIPDPQVDYGAICLSELKEEAAQEALKVLRSNEHNLDFGNVAVPYGFLERLLNADAYCGDEEPALGRRLLCLRARDRKSFAVFKMSQEDLKVEVPVYLAARDGRLLNAVSIVDNPEDDYSLVLCFVGDAPETSKDGHTLLVYKVTEDLQVDLLDYEFGLEHAPKKIACNQSWCCFSDNTELQRFRLLHFYDPAKVSSWEKVGDRYQDLVVVSKIVNLDSSSKLKEVDISSIDGLLLITSEKNIVIANSLGSQYKLSLLPEHKEEVVCAKFLKNSTSGRQDECFISLELTQGHIYSITDRNIGTFKTSHIQTFLIPIGQGGPKDINFVGSEVFLTENLLMIFFHGDFYFVCFSIGKQDSGHSAIPIVVGSIQAKLKYAERSHQVRFLETDLGKLLPICICKNFLMNPPYRLSYKLEGLLGDGLFSSKQSNQTERTGTALHMFKENGDSLPISIKKEDAVEGIPEEKSSTVEGTRTQGDSSVLSQLPGDSVDRAAPKETKDSSSLGVDLQEKEKSVVHKEEIPAKGQVTGGDLQEQPEVQEPEVENVSESDDEAAEETSRKSQESKPDTKKDSQEANSHSESGHELKDSAVEHAANLPSEPARQRSQGPDNQRRSDDEAVAREESREVRRNPEVNTSRNHFFNDHSDSHIIHDTSKEFDQGNKCLDAIVPKNSAFDNFIKIEMNIDANTPKVSVLNFEERESIRSMPIEMTPTNEISETQIDPKKEHKTHSVTPNDHNGPKKQDLIQTKNPNSKKPEKIDPKKRGRPRKDKEPEHTIVTRKPLDKDKQRNDKYVKDEFVPKDTSTIYREKEPKEKDKTKESNNFGGQQLSPERNTEEIEYVRKVKETPPPAYPQEKFLLKEQKSQQDDKKAELKEIKETSSFDIKPLLESLLESKLDTIEFGMKSLLDREGHREEVFKKNLRDVIESLVDEKLIKVLKENFNCLMSNNFNEVFEELVVPICEKYLTKVFDKTNSIFEKGLKFYVDKISIEERKASQLKDQFSLMMNQFLANSKVFSKSTQDFAQISKELTVNQNKEITKTLSDLEEKMEKFSEKQDKILDMMEKMMFNQQKNIEEDKKIDVPPSFKEISPQVNQREPQQAGQIDTLSEQLKSLIMTLQVPYQGGYGVPQPAPSLSSADHMRSYPGSYMMSQNPVHFAIPGPQPPMGYPYMNTSQRGNSFSSAQHSVGSTTPLPQQVIMGPPLPANNPGHGLSDSQIRDLLVSLSRQKDGDKE